LGVKTYTQYETELKLEIYNRDDLQSPVNYYQRWLNEAYLDIVSRKDLYFPILEELHEAQTTDGTQYVEAPSNTLFVRTVFDKTNTVKLRKVSWLKYISYPDRYDTTAEGSPNKWTHAGGGTGSGRIYLYPTPDDAYDLELPHRKKPPVLSGSSDVTLLGSEWDVIILKTAVWQTLTKLKEYEKAAQEKEVVDEMIRNLRGIYDRENIDRNDILQPHQAYLNR